MQAKHQEVRRTFTKRKVELLEIFREVGLVQILGLGETRSLLSHYWTEMAIKGNISIGDAGETILERIVMGIWLNVIFATRRDIGSGSQQSGGQHRQQNLNYENGNHGNTAQRFQRPISGG